MRTPLTVIANVLESVFTEPATWKDPAVRNRLVNGAQAYMRGVGMPVEKIRADYDEATGQLSVHAVDRDFEATVSLCPRKS